MAKITQILKVQKKQDRRLRQMIEASKNARKKFEVDFRKISMNGKG